MGAPENHRKMTKEELKKKYAVLDGWIKQYIGGKAFLFVAFAQKGRNYCIARSYYRGTFQISGWMNLEEMEIFLRGIIHAREVKAAARGRDTAKITLQWHGANVPGLVENGRLIKE